MKLPGLSFIRKGRGVSVIVRTVPAMIWLMRMPPPPSVSIHVAKNVMYELKKASGYRRATPGASKTDADSIRPRDASLPFGIAGAPMAAGGGKGTPGSRRTFRFGPGERVDVAQPGSSPQHDGGGSS